MKNNLARAALIVLMLFSTAVLAEDTKEIADKEWGSYTEPLVSMGGRVTARLTDGQDPQLRRELYKSIFAQLASGYLALLYADPQYPDFWPIQTAAFNSFAPNPDNTYYATPINDDGVYKISGTRGTVKRVSFQISTGQFLPRGELDDQRFGHTLANYDLDDIHHKKDGTFEVILSPKRPDGYKGDWWQLFPKATNIFVRQVSYDWSHDIDARLSIERLDRAAAKPRQSADELERNLKQMAVYTEAFMTASVEFVKAIRRDQGVNKIAYRDISDASPMPTQKYAYGGFDIDADEALIVEADLPKQCRYWGIHLMDEFGFTMNWMNHQNSLNGFTTQIGKDHKVRIVISPQDPGVPNWLDTSGYKTGAIQARWENCTSWPEYTSALIKVADVRKYFPADTPMVTVQARDETVRLRRKAVQMRKRW